MKKIGIDFGNFYTKIAWLNDTSDKLEIKCVRTEISYDNNENPYIGESIIAPIVGGDKKEIYFQFKRLLNSTDKNEQNNAKKYSKGFLSKITSDFKKNSGDVEEIVVCVRESWRRDTSNSNGVKNILKIFNEIGYGDKLQILSEPICAAAYYKHIYLSKEDTGENDACLNVLICDMGGRKFEATLCKIKPDRISIVCSKSSDDKVSSFIGGFYFDMKCLNNENELGKYPTKFDLFSYLLMKSFESKRMGMPSQDFNKLYELFFEQNTKTLTDTKFFTIDASRETRSDLEKRIDKSLSKIIVKFVVEAFKDTEEGISAVLKSIVEEAKGNEENIDKVILVGGFSSFPWVQSTLQNFFGGHYGEDAVPVECLKDPSLAISKGACLIANGKVNVNPFFPYEIGIETYRTKDGEYVKEEQIIIPADKYQFEMYAPKFNKTTFNIPNDMKMIPIYYKHNDEKEYVEIDAPEVAGIYSAGFKIDAPHNTKLYLRKEQSTAVEYDLNLPEEE